MTIVRGNRGPGVFVLPQGWVQRHSLKRIELFVRKVWVPDELVFPDQCWIWHAAVNGTGRGQFRMTSAGDSTTTAPRAAYLLFVGDLEDYEVVCHRCDDPMCVRPSHLFNGTQVENVADMRAKGRAWYQRRAA